ncbi:MULTISPECIES: Na+/H+ antiporter NhaC family protein [Desulfitobacterium]|uniref:Na+/H+ antiporter n=1 Tax=Desulfitobacterium dehalogenans (strain ATCC 51507 / DSM 9161 / JW/IU-DC1) TaxID=756499 RepID=I4A4Y0_DESDJ|nr:MULTISPECIES: Na+/H+ antiporter NhaC family protein [Desulfitobacterium]AFL99014.1 Na+/H+ antiporter [Desulfitobacterium dehalogenans ATCC 51507]
MANQEVENSYEFDASKKLDMYGGILGGLIPLFVLIGILVWLSVAERGGTQAFWAGGWLAIVAGLLFAKNKFEYCQAVLRGLGDKNGIVIVTAWLFAGVFGQLMVAGGLVEGLLWFGMEAGATGAIFVLVSFLAAMMFSLGTGTSTGTVLALMPVLYPAGIFLGANPAMLGATILAGAAFGDNLAPVSDTTIVSAFTQEATMKDVVRSRAPLSLTAAALAVIPIMIFGGGGTVSNLPEIAATVDPRGLLMLASFAVVVVLALKGRHIVESLIWGNICAAIIAMLTGKMVPSVLFHIPAQRGESTGLIEKGISGVTGAIIFALLVLAVTQILVESGVMNSILKWAEKTIAKTVRQAELSIIFVTIIASIPIAANAPAELLVGPSFVKPIGKKFNLAPARRANLMDCAVCSMFFTLPWHICVIVWYGAMSSAAQAFNLPLPSIWTALMNPYNWTLLAVLFFSVFTGWNRKYETPAASKNSVQA